MPPESPDEDARARMTSMRKMEALEARVRKLEEERLELQAERQPPAENVSAIPNDTADSIGDLHSALTFLKLNLCSPTVLEARLGDEELRYIVIKGRVQSGKSPTAVQLAWCANHVHSSICYIFVKNKGGEDQIMSSWYDQVDTLNARIESMLTQKFPLMKPKTKQRCYLKAHFRKHNPDFNNAQVPTLTCVLKYLICFVACLHGLGAHYKAWHSSICTLFILYTCCLRISARMIEA